MACAAIQTGHQYLAGMLGAVDCQARSIGAYGYGALADPASPLAGALFALLTIFVALFGWRLMFGAVPSGRDLVGEALRLGIALTLATSWPAFRTLAYDLVLDGPAEIAGSVGYGAGLPGGQSDLDMRLQGADDAIVVLTQWGTGRLNWAVAVGSDPGNSQLGVALADQSGLAWGRVAFLIGAIAPLGAVRLSAGILLALAPLLAGLLLFAGTRDLFHAWLRGLLATALGAIALMLSLGTELAVLEPWLQDALAQRGAGVMTPSMPTELLATCSAFAAINLVLLALLARLAFFSNGGWGAALRELAMLLQSRQGGEVPTIVHGDPAILSRDRALRLADAVAHSQQQELRQLNTMRLLPGPKSTEPSRDPIAPQGGQTGNENWEPALGSSYRRTARRHSAAAVRRDNRP